PHAGHLRMPGARSCMDQCLIAPQPYGQGLRVPSFDRNVIERGSYERYLRAQAATASSFAARGPWAPGPAGLMYSTSSSSSTAAAGATGGGPQAGGATTTGPPQYCGATTI